MAKKDFSEGIDSILGTETYEERIAKMKEAESIPKSIQQEVKIVAKPKEKEPEVVEAEQLYEKITLLIHTETIGKIRSMSFYSKQTIKDIINESLAKTIKAYEKKNGDLKVP